MSVTDSSEGDSGRDVSEVIVKLLSCGAKTPGELKKAVLGAVNVCGRTYFRHLNNLRNKAIIEEVADLGRNGKVIKRYVLKKANEFGNFVLVSEQQLSEHLLNFSKADWELYTWWEHDPDGWVFVDEHDELVVTLISHCVFPDDNVVLPEIVECDLDPDRYFFDWPRIYRQLLGIGDSLPRFFSLKRVFQAKCDEETDFLKLRRVSFFLGIKSFVDVFGVRRQVAVVVGRKSDGLLQVCRVEFFGRFSEEWVSELGKEYGVKGAQIFGCPDNVLMRRAVFHLDKVLEDRRLLVPVKYSLLLDDLRLFNFRYTPPRPHSLNEELMLKDYMETGGNFVHALSAAVLCADGLTKQK